MLSATERLLFVCLTLVSLTATAWGLRRAVRLIGAGQGRPDWGTAFRRVGRALARALTFQPVFRMRFWVSLFHALVGWGFLIYLLVNLFDLSRAFGLGWHWPLMWGNAFKWLADVFSGAVLLAMIFFVIRRFLFRPPALTARATTGLLPQARRGIPRDSALVAAFLIVHVGARLLGQSFAIARFRLFSCAGLGDPAQPLANLISTLWLFPAPLGPESLLRAEHLSFWAAFGSILLFLPYFPFSKHLHLLAAPLNFILKPPRRSMGEMSFINLADPALERAGATTLADLGWEQLLDAYACIMCFRCQEVCPAYQTGKSLSPAVLEINKRYTLNRMPAASALTSVRLTNNLIPAEAIWACTACGACVEVCPVGNEPMRDILDLRRALTLMEGVFPAPLETAFRHLERSGNPWGLPAEERLAWAEGLAVPTIAQNPEAEWLWWVGCAAAFDPRARQTARAFARLLIAAGVNFAVLGAAERCTADMARRAGREDIFFAHAQANVETLNALQTRRIVTTCPHCLHVLKNEYPAFGGQYTVIHHTQLLATLSREGRLPLARAKERPCITFHDPCYLARQNGIVTAPRQVLQEVGLKLVEMPHHGRLSFCCGAGGAQMWKEEEAGEERLNAARLAEARQTTAAMLTVACPFCLTMLHEASNSVGGAPSVREIAEVVAEYLEREGILE